MTNLGARKRTSLKVRIWSITSYEGATGTTYTVRWLVAGKKFPATFATRRLAETFRAKLLTAARDWVPFDSESGLPPALAPAKDGPTWYDHACAYVDMKWPHASGRHRRSISEALATVTPALLTSDRGAPEAAAARHALTTWSFNATARKEEPTTEVKQTTDWIAANSVSLAGIAEAATTRRALNALALKLDGNAAAPATISRKRATVYNALQYAVELNLLESNPIDRVHWMMPKSSDSVDRRVVVNPSQARRLITAVGDDQPALEAFFSCLYYATLRPAEALHLRDTDCKLPEEGWGEITLAGSTQQVGSAWGDSGDAKEDRGLKHRAATDTRVVPACPELVRILRAHLDTFGTAPDGRLFVTRTARFGRPLAGPYNTTVSTNAYARVWQTARRKALTAAQVASPLARRPYDLRHAAVSLWLNAGVPAPQVAEWAGHSVAVLLKVYAKCIYGQEDAARHRIEQALKEEPEAS